MKIVLTSWLREIVHAPVQFLLSAVGVALGVAAVVAVDIANHSARESFLAASEAMGEAATHIVEGPATDELYRQIRLQTQFPAQPVVRGRVRIAGTEDNSAEIFGIDPIAAISFADGFDGVSAPDDASGLIGEPYSAFATDATMRAFGINVGDSVTVSYRGSQHRIRITGRLSAASALEAHALESLLVTDIATAQSVLGMRGMLSEIQLLLPDDSESALAIESLLPKGVRLEGRQNRRRSILSVTDAFQTNLTAMSLLALLVAVFLIYNTMTFAVMRRKRSIGVLRALGVTRRTVAGCLAVEALCIGAVASVAGLALGSALSQQLLVLVERSISNLYFPINASATMVSGQAAVAAVALGLGATLASVVPALREATRLKPSFAPAYRRPTARYLRPSLVPVAVGSLFALTGVAAMQFNSESVVFGFVSIYLVIAGYLCLVPPACRVFARLLAAAAGRTFGIRGILASRAFSMTGSRTSVAICALCVAISATVGVSIMIGSFRTAVDGWLGDRLSADVYVTTSSGYGDQLSASDIERLRNLPQVERVGVSNWTWLEGPAGRSRVFAVDYGESAFRGYRFKDRVRQGLWERFQNFGVIVSEPYAWRHDLAVGDTVVFWHRTDDVALPVLGIYFDYSSDRGAVSMHRDVYIANFADESINAAALFAVADARLQKLIRAAGAAVTAQGAKVRSAAGLRQASMEIFDQTFAITAVLRTVAIVVAFIAVASVLAMIQIDREYELRILNAAGYTPGQIWRSASAETGVMGLFAGLLSIPAGLILTWMLIWVVNRRSFGWTMEMLVDPAVLFDAVALSVIAALLAGAVPAWRLARRAPRQISRPE